MTRAGFHFDSAEVAQARRVGSQTVTLSDLNCHFHLPCKLGRSGPTG
jgi:hypothetical protein